MIIAYFSQRKFQAESITVNNQDLLHDAMWIDLLNPSSEDEGIVESVLGFNMPTREEMQEIEFSSRLRKQNETLYMTVTMIAKSDSPEPKSDAVTLILNNNKLITVRYIEPLSFAKLILRLPRLSPDKYNAYSLFIELLDASIDRLADILESVSHRLDVYSQTIFRPTSNKKFFAKHDHKQHFQELGSSGDLTTKAQESLTTFNRLITFFGQTVPVELNSEMHVKLTMFAKDIKSLRNYALFLSNKVNFLLDATLGMVNIEQNNIIKIFSIAAVILLPPTLVASIYGMNFHHMPELAWDFGYPYAIGLMLFSAWLPYLYFKKKKWL